MKEHPALAKLREASAALRESFAKGEEPTVAKARELAGIEERILDIETGTIACRNCGASGPFVAWYVVDERQGIDVVRDEDGSLVYDYDGDTSSGEPGSDFEYRCRNCDTAASTLEYLVGDTDEDVDTAAVERADETIRNLQRECEYDPEEEGSVDDLIAYKDALEDAYRTALVEDRR